MQQNINTEQEPQRRSCKQELQAAVTKIQQQAQQAEVINQIIQAMNCAMVLDEVLQMTVELLQKVLRVGRCLILQPHFDSELVICQVSQVAMTKELEVYSTSLSDINATKSSLEKSRQIPDSSIELGNLINVYKKLYRHHAAKLAQAEPVVIPQLEQTRSFLEIQLEASACQVHSVLIVPILYQQSCWGGILLHQWEQEGEWTSDEIGFVQSVANLCALAMHQAKLAEALQTSKIEPRAEERLHQQEQSFKALAENAPDVIARFDRQMRFLYVNSAVESVSGISPHTFIGETNRSVGMPEDLCQSLEDNFQQVFITGQERIIEFDYLSPDGKTVYFQSRVVPEFAKDGSVECVLVVARDVTNFKLTEKALRESQQLLQAVLDSAPTAIYLKDLQGRYILCNHRTQTGIGLSLKQIIGKTDYDIWPQMADILRINDQAAVDAGAPVELEETVLEVGGLHTFMTIKFPLYDTSGTPYAICGISTDITERKQTEVALKESEQKYRNLVETCQGAIWSVDAEGRLTFINQAAKQLYGYEPEEMIGRHFSELVTPEQTQKGQEILERIIAGESIFHCEAECIRKDGTIFWVSCNAIALRDEFGNVLGTTGTSIDISDRKRIEEQLKASLQEKEALLKEVHHRVKNNLQVISSLLDLQSQQIQDSIAVDAFRGSRNRIKSIALIHEKLYQSKNLARVGLADYIHTLTTYLLHTYPINPSNITLQLSISNILLNIDKVIPLGLIINELVSNALKHGFPGNTKGTIWIEASSTSEISVREEARQLTLVIGNDGLRLEETKIFYKPKSLGFQLVNVLVKQLNGLIEVEQIRGTEFKINLPYL